MAEHGQEFIEYEPKVHATFRQHKLVALCTYCLDNCSASDVIDVCCQHQFALARREGTWELLESSSLKIAKDSLMQLNTALEARGEEGTGELRSTLLARVKFCQPDRSTHAASPVRRTLVKPRCRALASWSIHPCSTVFESKASPARTSPQSPQFPSVRTR